MNRIIVLAFFVLSIAKVQAQNKSLGVGTSTPNPNAALHVESPTGNQGAIMPRLSTAQRTAMGGILGVADAGLLLYDNDLKGLYIWDGVAWQSSAKLQFPIVDTVNTIPPNGNALRLVYNSTDVGNFGVAHFENINPNSGFSALIARTNSGINGAAGFEVSNPANSNDAVYVTSSGSGHGIHAINNSSTTVPDLTIATIYGESQGIAANGGSFRITNLANDRAAVFAETFGTGPGIYSRNTGTAGGAASFHVSNSGNNSTAMYARTDGTGTAVGALTTGTGTAGSFEINNSVSTQSALMVQTDGIGSAIVANQNNGGLAIEIAAGGIKNSLVTQSVQGTISAKAGVIDIDATGIYTLSTAGRVNGETIIITNSAVPGGLVRIELVGGYAVDLYNEYQTATFVFVNGVWKGTGAVQP